MTIAEARRGGFREGDGVKYSVFSGVLPELSAEEVCRHLARHGYDGVEWRVDGEYHWRAATVDRDAARIKEHAPPTVWRSRGSPATSARTRRLRSLA